MRVFERIGYVLLVTHNNMQITQHTHTHNTKKALSTSIKNGARNAMLRTIAKTKDWMALLWTTSSVILLMMPYKTWCW